MVSPAPTQAGLLITYITVLLKAPYLMPTSPNHDPSIYVHFLLSMLGRSTEGVPVTRLIRATKREWRRLISPRIKKRRQAAHSMLSRLHQ